MDEKGFTERYDKAMSFVNGEPRRKLYEAAALAAYRAQTDVPVVDTLLGDDAPQFDESTDDRSLCWVHEGRHYAKLTPMFEPFQKELETFQDRFWDYYRELRAYRAKPTSRKARRLENAFDERRPAPRPGTRCSRWWARLGSSGSTYTSISRTA